jgi:hypothetical protein
VIGQQSATLSVTAPNQLSGAESSRSADVARTLSALIAALMAGSSVLGLLIPSIYRDNDWARSGFRGNDLISLVLATPLLLGGMAAARRGSARGRIVWLGALAYALYNYHFYLFGAAFNDLFLVYVALVGLSIWALILALTTTDPSAVRRSMNNPEPVKWVAGNLGLIGLFLGLAWIAQSIRYVIDGTLPQSLIDSGIHTNIVFALDLTLVVPAMFVGAWLYWTRRTWGYVIAGILVIKAAAYTVALISMSFFAAAADVKGAWDLTSVWVAMSVISLISCWRIFWPKRGRVD